MHDAVQGLDSLVPRVLAGTTDRLGAPEPTASSSTAAEALTDVGRRRRKNWAVTPPANAAQPVSPRMRLESPQGGQSGDGADQGGRMRFIAGESCQNVNDSWGSAGGDARLAQRPAGWGVMPGGPQT